MRKRRPDDAFHTRMVLSADPDTMRDPCHDTDFTQSVCPFKVCKHFPDDASHTRKVLSDDPDTILVPSGENATDLTMFS